MQRPKFTKIERKMLGYVRAHPGCKPEDLMDHVSGHAQHGFGQCCGRRKESPAERDAFSLLIREGFIRIGKSWSLTAGEGRRGADVLDEA